VSKIEIKNKLLVVGGRVAVPGFEPLSEQTTNNLSIAMQGSNAYIDVKKALQLIPEAKVVIARSGGPNSGTYGHDMWLELPSGPPPDGNKCPEEVIIDYYKILRDSARSSYYSNDKLDIDCGGYDDVSLGLCPIDEFSEGLE
jgi:hypothetical protein